MRRRSSSELLGAGDRAGQHGGRPPGSGRRPCRASSARSRRRRAAGPGGRPPRRSTGRCRQQRARRRGAQARGELADGARRREQRARGWCRRPRPRGRRRRGGAARRRCGRRRRRSTSQPAVAQPVGERRAARSPRGKSTRAGSPALGPRLDQRAGGGLAARHQVRLDAGLAQRAGGAGSDGGDAHVPVGEQLRQAAGALLRAVHQHRDRGRAGHARARRTSRTRARAGRRRASVGSSGGTVSMSGTTTASAPAAASATTAGLRPAVGRGTSTRQPESGRTGGAVIGRRPGRRGRRRRAARSSRRARRPRRRASSALSAPSVVDGAAAQGRGAVGPGDHRVEAQRPAVVGQRPTAPIGAAQPASRRASRARSATTARRVGRWSSARRARASGAGRRSGADLDRERALAGGGGHDVRAEHLGDRVEAAQAGQAGAREDHGVEVARTGAAPATRRGGCRRCRGCRRRRGRGGRRAAGRRGAGSRCRRVRRAAGRRASGRRGRRGRRPGPRAAGRRRSTRPSASPVGRSLSECTATSQRPSSRASRSAVTKTPGAAEALQRAGQPVAVGADVDGLEGEVAAPGGEGVDHVAGLGEREGARARPDPHVLEHAVSVPLRRGDVEVRGNRRESL